MLGQFAIGEAHDVGHHPGGRLSMAGEAAMQDDVVAVGDDELMFVTQFGGQ